MESAKTDDRTTCVFEIFDGGTHWVAADSHANAIKILAESAHEGVDEYIEELGQPVCEVFTRDYLRVDVTDDAPAELTKNYPRGTRVEVRIPRDGFKDLEHGLIATTEY